MTVATEGRHLRQRSEQEQRATNLELFFDLVFVFAVTQLSHLLGSHLTLAGAGQTALLLLVTWWAWVYTTWMTNWFDPDSPVVRCLLITVMLASLAMAIAIPQAFGDRALMFALGYGSLQVIRNAFVVWATDRGSQLHAAFVRILTWSLVVAVLWVAGALLDDGARVAVWTGALALDYLGPAAGYWLPGIGRSAAAEWDIEGSHFAERFQLFIIIALGESIVVTGTTASSLHVDAARAAAIAVSFVTSAAMWWLYFDFVATIAQRRLATSNESGALARDAYTYIHTLMVAGIIVAAVGDAVLIARPGVTATAPQLAALAGGPALYLAGHVAFRWRMARSWSPKRVTATGALVLAGLLGALMPALACATLILAVLITLIVAELVAGVRRRRRGDPSPLQALAAVEAQRSGEMPV